MTKILMFLSLLMCAPAFAETLTFADGALTADVTWIKGPQPGTYSEMKLEWKSGVDKTRVEPPGPVKIVLWMPSMGHGSSPVTVEKMGQEPGVYTAKDIFFSMGGIWDVRFVLTYNNGRVETQTLPVKIAGGGHHH